jgi:hypothetical protein
MVPANQATLQSTQSSNVARTLSLSVLIFLLLPGVTRMLQQLFPPVPDPNFVASTLDVTGLDTNDTSDWTVPYFAVAQQLQDAVVSVGIVTCGKLIDDVRSCFCLNRSTSI